eukprot:scaffold1947_cov207-Prasinococcus_capsulatus_cf.AAC.29
MCALEAHLGPEEPHFGLPRAQTGRARGRAGRGRAASCPAHDLGGWCPDLATLHRRARGGARERVQHIYARRLRLGRHFQSSNLYVRQAPRRLFYVPFTASPHSFPTAPKKSPS